MRKKDMKMVNCQKLYYCPVNRDVKLLLLLFTRPHKFSYYFGSVAAVIPDKDGPYLYECADTH